MRLPDVFHRPRSLHSRQAPLIAFAVCIVALAVIRVLQRNLPDAPPMGGLVLIIVAAALWTLPARLGWTVVVIAFGSAPVSLALDGSTTELVTQLIAIVIIAVLAEITVRSLKAEERRRESTAEQLRHFAATAAHELRTPLTAMRSEMETTLRAPRSSEALLTAMHRVLRQTDRLITANEALLTLARSDAGVLRIGGDPVDLADLAEEASARWQAHARARHVDVVVHADDSAVIEGDAALLGQLLDNLLDNALRYAPPQSAVVISVDSADAAHGHVVTVSDSGPGIPPDLQPHIFERFVRGDGKASRKGAGIGLALCAAVAHAHGGSITLNDTAEPGTQVVVALPESHAARSAGRIL